MLSQKKPHTAITVLIENLTSGDPSITQIDDLSGLPELVEVINLQPSGGPTEAARAIRKKLKYGSTYRQLRALTLLDALIQNAGPNFQRNFADEALLERLRFCGSAGLSSPEVKTKCGELFRRWAAQYKNTPGMGGVVSLYRELPKRKRVVTQEQSRVIRETENPFGEDEEEEAKPSPASPPGGHSRATSLSGTLTQRHPAKSYDAKNTKKDKKDKKSKKTKAFNFEAEKDQMKLHIGEAFFEATNLTNTLQSIDRERERISENQLAAKRFEHCKQLRRKILRYIHHVEAEEWLGNLLNANDALVTALMTFEQLDRSIDADSDSDDELAEQAHLYRMAIEKGKGRDPASPTASSPPTDGIANLNLGSPQSSSSAALPTPPTPRRPPPPPRPSGATKPAHFSSPPPQPPRPTAAAADSDAADSEEEVEDDDEGNPFSDRNQVVKAE
ncbi:hypothetical protein B0J18DRAFT_468445 [Chaetomium sp. MPI-SDFR-AT-0129]|nr:hypothetical protein B0J18DRAFT_468445 [Chaetomium sp. MPI-SDFR-AT-0129]